MPKVKQTSYPIELSVLLPPQFDGVFYFMKITYKTKTTVQGRFVDIQIFQNGELWVNYDFDIERLDEMVNYHLIGKRWATPENLVEIRDSVLQHLNQN